MDIKNLITIIVPVYNAAASIDRCINSILGQSYKNIELVLVDDGSTDNSLSICQKYADLDNRVVIIKQTNSGVAVTRNTGLDNAKGDYILFVDSDDYIDIKMCETMLSKTINENADLAVCKYCRVLDNNLTKVEENALIDAYCNKKYSCFFSNVNNVHGAIWRVLFSKFLIGSVRFSANIKVQEDLLFLITVLKNSNKTVFVDEYLYYYITDDYSYIKKYYNERYIKDYFLVAEKLLKLFKFSSECMRSWLYGQYVNIIMCKIYDKNIKSIYNYLSKEQLQLLRNRINRKAYLQNKSNWKSMIYVVLYNIKCVRVFRFLLRKRIK